MSWASSNARRLLLVVATGAVVHATSARAQAAATTGTLAGVVKDTLGRPLADAEVLIQELNLTVRSDAGGEFLLGGVRPGSHEVWIRHIGYIIVQFRWAAKANERVETAITMRPLPNTLDPVVVYANETRETKSKSVIRGTVLDSAGFPVDGAEIQLIGAGRASVTAEDGSFIFRHVPPGELMVRARMMGYSPAAVRVKLGDDDTRDIYLRMGNLAQQLSAVEVTAQSGFGSQAVAFRELDQRTRWRMADSSSVILGPDRLKELGSTPLDFVARGFPKGFVRAGTSIIPGNSTPITHGGLGAPGDACILENGWRPVSRPLSSYAASDIDMLEYYPAPPPETDNTSTVQYRMTGLPSCDGIPGAHPAYYVLWLKGAK